MIEFQAVVSAYHSTPFRHWPVADQPPDDLIVLSGDLAEPEVGKAIAAIAEYNQREAGSPDAFSLLRALAGSERVVVSGGLRARDTTTGVTIEPGCCCGLEDWRDWFYLVHGAEPWLGHDPEPKLEFGPGVARLWPDADREATAPPLEIPLADLPARLAAIQRDLRDFVGLVRKWAEPYGPALAADLAAALDDQFHVSEPFA
ncbi:hypothetical protein SAMN05421504_101571 [Amycolatopsis xylanica]|uniref:Uncharacterized protein n=1 Tax=Amycolatopsis xylanica TaxID=589385 RepID=A0A1H2TI50_9PSEU|nr:hypothetical protein [Amycolatopsis xylanica]SDW43518.1 hypothetical protein SAMN05421504_101571 [Amycolatopsis xylanica]